MSGHLARHGYFCSLPLSDGVKVRECLCGLAELEAKAAKWDAHIVSIREQEASGDDDTLYRVYATKEHMAALEADAAKWRAKDAMDKALAEALIAQQTDARRWRTLERAARDANVELVIQNAAAGGAARIIGWRFERATDIHRELASGPTLASTVDKLAERLDKESGE